MDDRGIYRFSCTPANTREEQPDIDFFSSQIDKLNEEKHNSNMDGIENTEEDEECLEEDEERNPYDPEKIRVETKNFSIAQVLYHDCG